MANLDQLEILKQGVKVWNEWRMKDNWTTPIDLSDADLSKFELDGINLSRANLSKAKIENAFLRDSNFEGAELFGVRFNGSNLQKANLSSSRLVLANLSGANLINAMLYKADLSNTWLGGANFSGANLSGANLNGALSQSAKFIRADLSTADLIGANLQNAILRGANIAEVDLRGGILVEADLTGAVLTESKLSGVDLTKADLTGANLSRAVLIGTIIGRTILKGCYVYGLSAWDLIGVPQDQSDLIITGPGESTITVGDLRVAQFIHLLLDNKNVRNVIDTITSKAVLILGRFTEERKAVLDTLANELRKRNLLPIIFDFEQPINRDFTETIKTLAGLSLFIIADITNPKSSPLELQATIPDYQIPFVTIIQQDEKHFSMFSDLQSKYDWVLPVIEYDSVDNLIMAFEEAIINRAWHKHHELQLKKAKEVEVLSIKDFIKEKAS